MRLGKAWQGEARHGQAWLGVDFMRSKGSTPKERQKKARRGGRGVARRGVARHGLAGHGIVR